MDVVQAKEWKKELHNIRKGLTNEELLERVDGAIEVLDKGLLGLFKRRVEALESILEGYKIGGGVVSQDITIRVEELAIDISDTYWQWRKEYSLTKV